MLGFGPIASAPLGALPDTIVMLKKADAPSITVQAIVSQIADHDDGKIVLAIPNVWREIVAKLGNDWSTAYSLPPRIWEELIAASLDQAGYDEVILTPRSGDFGRDVIATKFGVGAIRILGSVKAKAPGNLVSYDDVRSLIGVVHGDHAASKGIITTTTDFPPNILADKHIAPLIPTRLELLNGQKLREWLLELSGTHIDTNTKQQP